MLDAILMDFDHTIAHLGTHVRWDDAREAMVPLYRAAGVPEEFLQAHEGSLSLYRDVANAGVLTEDELRNVQPRASRVLEEFEFEAAVQTAIIPEASEALRKLRERGLRAGIVSSNSADVVSSVLDREGGGSVIEVIVGRHDVKYIKPSPEGLLRCCEEMKLAPERCVFVGDATNDIEAARAAGMAGYGLRGGVSTEEELLAAGAEAVFDDLSGVIEVLERVAA